MNRVLSGRCLCEAVRYEVHGPLRAARHCHCSICRRLSGTSHGTYARVDPATFRWVSGDRQVRVYASSPGVGRVFCATCGATLGAEIEGAMSYLALGCVDGDPGVRPEAHVFYGSRAPWSEAFDSLPRFEQWHGR